MRTGLEEFEIETREANLVSGLIRTRCRRGEWRTRISGCSTFSNAFICNAQFSVFELSSTLTRTLRSPAFSLCRACFKETLIARIDSCYCRVIHEPSDPSCLRVGLCLYCLSHMSQFLQMSRAVGLLIRAPVTNVDLISLLQGL